MAEDDNEIPRGPRMFSESVTGNHSLPKDKEARKIRADANVTLLVHSSMIVYVPIPSTFSVDRNAQFNVRCCDY